MTDQVLVLGMNWSDSSPNSPTGLVPVLMAMGLLLLRCDGVGTLMDQGSRSGETLQWKVLKWGRLWDVLRRGMKTTAQ